MNKILNLILTLIFFTNLLVSAQTKEWKTEFSEHGKIEVHYAIFDSVSTKGEEVKYIEYNAQTNTTATIEKCVEVFNNPEMHRKFYEYTDQSEKVKDISDNEWVIYYYYSPPWPIADSDCVSRIIMKSDSTNSIVVFTSFSEPNLIEMKDVDRSELNNITFTFSQINEKEVVINISAILIPVTSAPSWMMSGWFPDGPADILHRFKALAEEK